MADPPERQYLYPVGWEKFQHYGKRSALWMKVYGRLMSQLAYTNLPLVASGLLHRIWLLSLNSGECMPFNASELRQFCNLRRNERITQPLELLVSQGFLEVRASNLLAGREEKRREENRSIASSSQTPPLLRSSGDDLFGEKPPAPKPGTKIKAEKAEWEAMFHSHFWPAYPRKVAKALALRSWNAKRPKPERFKDLGNAILGLLRERKRYEWIEREVEHIPNPSTFLRGEEFKA